MDPLKRGLFRYIYTINPNLTLAIVWFYPSEAANMIPYCLLPYRPLHMVVQELE